MRMILATAIALTPASASAAVTVYDSYAAFAAAGPVAPTTSFDAPDPFARCGDNVCDLPRPFTLGPVRFTASTYLALYDDYATYIGGSPDLALATSPARFVGLYYGAYYGETTDIAINGVTVATRTLDPFTIGFIGFRSDAPITQIAFTGGETDIERGFLSAVPEPAVWLQLIAGFGLVGILGRRERRSA